jgi:hypothetical protein
VRPEARLAIRLQAFLVIRSYGLIPEGGITNMDKTGRSATLDWTTEDDYWRTNYNTRPYASGTTYDRWQPGYRYGWESAQRYQGRNWNDVENDLRTDWDRYEHRGTSTWEQIKAAVRDAWNRITTKDTN